MPATLPPQLKAALPLLLVPPHLVPGTRHLTIPVPFSPIVSDDAELPLGQNYPLHPARSDLYGVVEVPGGSCDQPGVLLRPDRHHSSLGQLDVKPDGVVNHEVGEQDGVVLQLVEATEVGLPGDTDPLLLVKQDLQVPQGPSGLAEELDVVI